MKIGVAQMSVVPGAIETNIATMTTMITEAKTAGCAVVAFPEMCVGGYLIGDRWLDESFVDELIAANDRLASLSDGIVLLYGNAAIEPGAVNKDGRRRTFNAGYCFQNGNAVSRSVPVGQSIAIKGLLPNYRIFDDQRYFLSLTDAAFDEGCLAEQLVEPFSVIIEGKTVRIGLEICEDLWFNDYRRNGEPFNISKILMDKGADLLINISASPWTFGKSEARDRRILDVKRESGRLVPFVYVNCVGVQNNGKNIVTFDGDSTVYGSDGSAIKIASAPHVQELVVFDSEIDTTAKEPKRISAIEAKFQAAVAGIRGLDTIMGNSAFPFIIGLSGGIDSAVVAGLVTAAVGPNRVVTFNLPSRYNSAMTKGIAARCAESLGIALHTISIEEMAGLNSSVLDQFNPTEFNRENIQAKVRGSSILSNAAGILNGVMTNNGNKVEVALGYATLYGDVNGAIAPLGDLLKTEVFDMARFLNETVFGREVVPAELIPDEQFRFVMPPSAELKDNQIDPMKWGYHDALVRHFTEYRRISAEQILVWYAEGKLAEKLSIPESLLVQWGLTDPKAFIADLEWFCGCFQRGVFKRIQCPPVIIMSRGSFGYDVRESQLPVFYSSNYKALRAKLLGE